MCVCFPEEQEGAREAGTCCNLFSPGVVSPTLLGVQGLEACGGRGLIAGEHTINSHLDAHAARRPVLLPPFFKKNYKLTDAFLLMRKIIHCWKARQGRGEGNGHLTRLPQTNCREFGLGDKSEDALVLARLPHRRAARPGVALLGPDSIGSPSL